MKRLLSILLVLVLAGVALSGCDRRSTIPDTSDAQDGSFAPETTAVGGLTQAVEEQGADSTPEYDSPVEAPLDEEPASKGEADEPSEQEIVQDQPIEADGESAAEAEATPESNMPFATPTPQPNTAVSDYSEVSASGLGFRFSYPSDWINIPGRSTVCYVQPLENGTVYPARVSVTMKRMPHVSNFEEAQNQLAAFIKNLMQQYDESTFSVDLNLDYSTKFMGNNAIATTYLAYDGAQEIKGYTIITFYDRYLFVYHFLCAYDDYPAFESAMRYMRDSVQADASVAPK